MRYQETVVRVTQRALDDLSRAARAVPEDRLDWTAGGNARSTLAQMQEIAMAGSWFLPIVRDRKPPEFTEHEKRESVRLRRDLDTIEKCIEHAQTTTGELCRVIAEFPDEALEQEIAVPFGGGGVMVMADILLMHYWNLTYHLGQVNQIQLLLGDRTMH